MTTQIESMRLELRRGSLTLAVLQALNAEHYGYSLRKFLGEAGLAVEEGTLYPLVRRLESYGLLESRWSEGDGRRRRYYRISAKGKKTLKILMQDWDLLYNALEEIKENKR